YLQPAGGFFGARKANEPIHIQFSYDDRSVVVVNGLQQRMRGLKASAELYDFNLKKQFSREATVDAGEDSSQKLFAIPELNLKPAISFARLRLEDEQGRTLSSNFYWLPAKYSTFDWAATTFEYTPSPTYEDLTQLNGLPPVTLKLQAVKASEQAIRVTVNNPSPNLAFHVVLKVLNKADGHEILPVLWDDNYFELLPGESKMVTAVYEARQLQNVQTAVELGGWNVIRQTVALTTVAKKK